MGPSWIKVAVSGVRKKGANASSPPKVSRAGMKPPQMVTPS